jgi:hypothetical protein
MHPKEMNMTEIQSGLISRRTAFSLMSAALGVALPVTTFAVSEVEAQTAGMERREDRRANRQDRREDRREDRQTRRDERRGVTTGSTAPASPK